MPPLDGDGLLARLRSSRLARLRQMPVLMIAGDNDEEANARARALGASDFIAGASAPANCWRASPRLLRWPRRRTSCARIRNATPSTRIPDYRPASTSKCRRRRPCRMPCARVRLSILIMGFDRFDALRERARRRSGQGVAQTFRSMLAKRCARKTASATIPAATWRWFRQAPPTRPAKPSPIACAKPLRWPILRCTASASICRSALASPIPRSIG
jgi:hypothetical protein